MKSNNWTLGNKLILDLDYATNVSNTVDDAQIKKNWKIQLSPTQVCTLPMQTVA